MFIDSIEVAIIGKGSDLFWESRVSLFVYCVSMQRNCIRSVFNN